MAALKAYVSDIVGLLKVPLYFCVFCYSKAESECRKRAVDLSILEEMDLQMTPS